jgi:PIN domain nuclease of toxin-antitoxin system
VRACQGQLKNPDFEDHTFPTRAGRRHLLAIAGLPMHHRDPFGHMLIAQAISEDAIFISGNRNAARYPVQMVTCSGRAASTLPGTL